MAMAVVVGVWLSVWAKSTQSLDSLGLCLLLPGALASSKAFLGCQKLLASPGLPRGGGAGELGTATSTRPLQGPTQPGLKVSTGGPGEAREAREADLGMSLRRGHLCVCVWGVPASPSLLHVCPSCPPHHVNLQTSSLVPRSANG